ncbi:hypothetical protein BN2497_10087 [Janthinobacterium sp. CG23_2]|nr:hypothetical protein BN2497_10087 [Janthinobacterium sp. CG23_2]CUU31441.1 hypothetical protein BN3177_10087 [Janthinobacterium sp. CG23_2]
MLITPIFCLYALFAPVMLLGNMKCPYINMNKRANEGLGWLSK